MPLTYLNGLEDGGDVGGLGGSYVAGRTGKCFSRGLTNEYCSFYNDPSEANYRVIPDNTTTMTFGFAYRPASLMANGVIAGPIGGDATGTKPMACGIAMQLDGSITFHQGASLSGLISGNQGQTIPGLLQANAWVYLEVQVFFSTTVGTVKVRVNNTERLNLTNVNTTNTTGSVRGDRYHGLYLCDQLSLSNAPLCLYDDVYICAGVGDPFLGDMVIETLYPNGNGAVSQWIGSDNNSVDNYLYVDETGQPSTGTGDIVRSSVVGQQDLYQFQNVTPMSSSTVGIYHAIYALKSDSGPSNIKIVSRGATDTKSPALPLSVNHRGWGWCQPVNPETGLAWTQTELNALQAGVEVA